MSGIRTSTTTELQQKDWITAIYYLIDSKPPLVWKRDESTEPQLKGNLDWQVINEAINVIWLVWGRNTVWIWMFRTAGSGMNKIPTWRVESRVIDNFGKQYLEVVAFVCTVFDNTHWKQSLFFVDCNI